MVAARLANMSHGGNRKAEDQAANLPVEITQTKAAEMLNVGERSLRSAKQVITEGSPELVQAVERGQVSVSAAAEVDASRKLKL